MNPYLKHAFHYALAGMLSVALAACGGGGSQPDQATTTSAAPSEATSAADGRAVALATAATSEEGSAQLIVRAYGTLAGDVGPMLLVRVNDKVVGSTEVRSTAPADYVFRVAGLVPGSKVDVAYTNDASVGTADRNLFIDQVTAGKTYVLPTMEGVTLDRGAGEAAFDGLDTVAGRNALYGNSALRFIWPKPNMPTHLTVRASGVALAGQAPAMVVRVDGIVVGSSEVRDSNPADFSYAVPEMTVGSRVDIVFTNAETVNGESRQLKVHYLRSGDTVLLPNSPGVIFDRGSGNAALDGRDTMQAPPEFVENGALRGKWPAANMSEILTVRAGGSPAAGVAPVMQVLVDGVALGSATVSSTDLKDYSFPSLPIKPGNLVQVLFSNPGSSGNETRSLDLAYAISGKTYLQVGASSLSAPWPEPNLTDTITVRARGSLAGNVGPLMQVLVDGVIVGATEVRNIDFADFTFFAPAMQPGRKVDIVFNNDAVIGTADRNLYVAYLISGTTFVVPGNANSTFDRGLGSAAFDGANTVGGSTSLFSNGALRTSWPQPNITSTLTVRASGTLAGNVGPVMRIWVDGVAVSSIEVRSSTPADYVMAVPPLAVGSKVEVTFDNPGTVDDVQRQLDVAYLKAGNTVLKPGAGRSAYAAGNLQAVWPAANLTDTLTVRAYGVLAGDIGPILQVMVDGVLVGSTEVRTTEPADYRFAVPPMTTGAKVDLIYVNDAVVGGVDRNLFILQAAAGKAALLMSSPTVQFDRGSGAGATDGIDVVPGQPALYANGALRFSWPEATLTEKLIVRASGTTTDGTPPSMTVRVDGLVVGTADVVTTEPADFSFDVPPLSVGARIDVAYTNHPEANGQARSLSIHYLRSGDSLLLPATNGNVFDLGKGLAAFDYANTQSPVSTLKANGALRGKWPAVNMSDTLTVRAGGTAAAGVAPIMQVLVDGVVLGSVTVSSPDLANYSFAALPIKPGSLVQVLFSNPGSAGNETRSLNIAYAISGKTYLQAAGNSLSASWPEPNLTDTITVRAKGSLAGNVGPMMQILVDGVMVGSTEVRNTDFADFTFQAPLMQPGRKVDIVFNNDAMIGSADRNLFVAYLIAGATYVVPTSANSSFDRGLGNAAFDGANTVAGSGNLYSNGALRTLWPQPNITSTVTVRASGTVAGNIGPFMQIRVDGVQVSGVEVRSPVLTDYVMRVPPIKPGSLIDVVFSNHGIVDGVSRSLNVSYVLSGNTFVLPSTQGVRYDLGLGNAAFDGKDTLPGQSAMSLAGALRFAWPSVNLTDRLTVRASATLAANVGALMQVRVDGVIVGTQEVRSTTATDYVFATPALRTGSRIDIAFLNDEVVQGQDRNLFVQYVLAQGRALQPNASYAVVDSGTGEAAFDGNSTSAGASLLTTNGALRITVPEAEPTPANQAARYAASRFLQQATFGPTISEIDRVASQPLTVWLNNQMAIPPSADFVDYIQAWYDLGPEYRPGGAKYNPTWLAQRFWATAALSPDALRKRVAFALHQIFVVSQSDSNLYHHSRAYAAYLDTLNRHAFGNFRNLIEDVALSPAMGIYLSHMRNRKEDPVSGRVPDENFAREVMQLFTIGLHELNIDGTPQLDGQGQPIETYSNEDVMAMAKVFTGWSWAAKDSMLTEAYFRWGWPDYSAANDQRTDILKMMPYPGQHSTAEKRIFQNKPHALTIGANTPAQESLRLALDALFRHPNVGPFIGRQLIQRLVSSHPSPAYVARVASVFNNNGAGVRGDMAAVVRAILLDPEAITPPVGSIGKLREPVQRVAHWMRSFEAKSVTGQYMMSDELDNQSQRALYAPSVFGYFRPGFVPPNTSFSTSGITVPEFQIVNESTTAQWVNAAQWMAGSGLGWTGNGRDVVANLQPLADLSASGRISSLIEQLNLLLYAGRMSSNLKQDLLEAITTVAGNDAASHLNRARVALFLALASPEYLVQR